VRLTTGAPAVLPITSPDPGVTPAR
jgi:hypothetical protein